MDYALGNLIGKWCPVPDYWCQVPDYYAMPDAMVPIVWSPVAPASHTLHAPAREWCVSPIKSDASHSSGLPDEHSGRTWFWRKSLVLTWTKAAHPGYDLLQWTESNLDALKITPITPHMISFIKSKLRIDEASCSLINRQNSQKSHLIITAMHLS